MISDYELKKAIEKCENEQNPNANTCYKLASYYIIKDHRTANVMPTYSAETPLYTSQTDFGKVLQETDINSVLKVIDELLETLRVFDPRLYKAFMKKLAAL